MIYDECIKFVAGAFQKPYALPIALVSVSLIYSFSSYTVFLFNPPIAV